MPDIIRKNKKGSTLIELMIVLAVLLVVLVAAYNVWTHNIYNFYKMESRIDVRQSVRLACDVIIKDIMNASYIFAGQNVKIEGVQYNIPIIDAEGKNLLLAIPENANVGSIKYTVVGYYLLKNSTDSVNPNAYDLMRYSVSGVSPVTADMPATIDLTKLANGMKKRIVGYIDYSNFSFLITDSGGTVQVKPLATKRLWGQQSKPEVFNLFIDVKLRNK